MAIQDYSTNPSNNQYINGVFIGEDCPPANINNAIREVMADQATANFTTQISNVQYLAQQADNKAQQAMDNVSTVNAQAAASANLAKDYKDEAKAWAEGSDADVSTYQPGGHSAKTYAADAQAYAQAADTAELNAEHWAEGTDADVAPLGGTHSAQGWAQIAGTDSANAKKWAEGSDQEVSALGGTHSAKGWAEEAEAAVVSAKDKIGQVRVVSIYDDSLAGTKFVETGKYYLKTAYPDLAKLYPYEQMGNATLDYTYDATTNPLAVNNLPLSNTVADETIMSVTDNGDFLAMIDSTRTKVLVYQMTTIPNAAPSFTLLHTIDPELDYLHAVEIKTRENNGEVFIALLGGEDSSTIDNLKTYSFMLSAPNALTANAGLTVSLTPACTIDSTGVSLTNKPLLMGLFFIGNTTTSRRVFFTVKTGASEITRYLVVNGNIYSDVKANYALLAKKKNVECFVDDNSDLKYSIFTSSSSLTGSNVYSATLTSVAAPTDIKNVSIANSYNMAISTQDSVFIVRFSNISASAYISYFTIEKIVWPGIGTTFIAKAFISPDASLVVLRNNGTSSSTALSILFKKQGEGYIRASQDDVLNISSYCFNGTVINQGVTFSDTRMYFPKQQTSFSQSMFYVPLYEVPAGFRSYVRALD